MPELHGCDVRDNYALAKSKGSNLSRVRSEQLANPKTDCREILGLFSF